MHIRVTRLAAGRFGFGKQRMYAHIFVAVSQKASWRDLSTVAAELRAVS
jgi:hypothetical protein